MRKCFCMLLCLCFGIPLVGCNKGTDNYGKNIIKTGSISDNIEVKLIDDASKVWLDNSHFKAINIKSTEDTGPFLEFVTTEEGKKQLHKATEANIGKPLSLIADEMLLFSPIVTAPIEEGAFTLSNTKTYDAIYTFNLLIDAPDKTQGLTPPQDIITVEQAQDIVFASAGVARNEVTELETNLEFDEDWRGWEYDIDFNVGDTEYESEVNAISGTVIKLYF